MTTIIHKPDCIGGVKGPCNCGAVDEAEKHQDIARRRHMLNVIRETKNLAGDLERQTRKLLEFADKTQMELDEFDRLHGITKPPDKGVTYAPIDNPA